MPGTESLLGLLVVCLCGFCISLCSVSVCGLIDHVAWLPGGIDW